jgi:hypothetical protein
MKWSRQLGNSLIACTMVGFIGSSLAQSAQQTPVGNDGAFAVVDSVRILSDHDAPTIEIVSNRPLVPAISKLDNPPRLVIDLPKARLLVNQKRIDSQAAGIQDIRFGQYQERPPVARIVVDLAKPVAYSSEATGNLLLVRLGGPEKVAKAAAAAAPAVRPVTTPVRDAASSTTVVDGSRLAAGSSVSAGADAAVVRLARGGEVRVCPGTTVSVTPSQNNRSLMLAMSTGALEAHYALEAAADSILTPDFRILLAGPGEFHYAVSADSRGNTCIQTLPGNTASVIVSELLGDGTYQVKPADQVLFRSGQLKGLAVAGPGSCGCPAPASQVMLASAPPSVDKPQPPTPLGDKSPETAALPQTRPNEVHVQVDAPFVFRAEDLPANNSHANAPAPAPIKIEGLPLRSPTPAEPLSVAAVSPPQTKPERHGFFGKLRGFFAAIFG